MSAVAHLLANPFLATLRWNPTVRGILFPGIQFLVLCGSCYVILATNIGNRLGFLLANAAFWGWMVLMTIVWMIYGIGLKGPAPSWQVKEAIGDTRSAQVEMVRRIPNEPSAIVAKGWRSLREGNATRGEGLSAVDAYLKETGQISNYMAIGVYETGGEQVLKVWPKVKLWETAVTDTKTGETTYKSRKGKWYNPKDYAFRGLLHKKRYLVAQVQAVKTEDVKVAGVVQYDDQGKAKQKNIVVDGKTVADETKPVMTVVAIRNLGAQRRPPFLIFLSSLLLLAISLGSLHRRDKQVMAAMGQLKARAA